MNNDFNPKLFEINEKDDSKNIDIYQKY